MRILVVAKQTFVTELALYHRLCDRQYQITLSPSVDEGLSTFRHRTFDLVVVDTSTLGEEGFEFIRRLRTSDNDTPVMAHIGSQPDDLGRALRLGANDAMTSPIDDDALDARLGALVGRDAGDRQTQLQSGDLALSPDTREVRFRQRPVKLSAKEYSMLELLLLRKGQTVTPAMFLNRLYGGTDEPETRILDVLLCKLRTRLRLAGAHDVIATVYGHGYTIGEIERGQSAVSFLGNRADQIITRSQVMVGPLNPGTSAD